MQKVLAYNKASTEMLGSEESEKTKMATIQEIKATVAEMPAEIRNDLKGRMKTFQSGQISKEDVILFAKNTIQWLQDNDHEDEVPFYQQFLEGVENL